MEGARQSSEKIVGKAAGRAPPPRPGDLLSDRQPELTRGHVFAAPSRTPSECGDRSYRMKPLSRQTPTPCRTPGLLRRFTRFQPPSISFNDLQVYHCCSGARVCVCAPCCRTPRAPNPLQEVECGLRQRAKKLPGRVPGRDR